MPNGMSSCRSKRKNRQNGPLNRVTANKAKGIYHKFTAQEQEMPWGFITQSIDINKLVNLSKTQMHKKKTRSEQESSRSGL